MKIFLDGPTLVEVATMIDDVDGFTTNPTLMRKLGTQNYEDYGRSLLEAVDGKPVSLEVFADTPDEMIQQGLTINGWGRNAWIKIPVCTTDGRGTRVVINALLEAGCKVNITAVLAPEQVSTLAGFVKNRPSNVIVSVFAGRIADTGINPYFLVRNYCREMGSTPVLWASTRQVLSYYDAEAAGCSIITMSAEMIRKQRLMRGMDLTELSIETVRMFRNDALKAGYSI